MIAPSLRPGLPGDRVTMSTGIAYDPGTVCPRWLRFLDEVFIAEQDKPDSELIDFVHRAVGYSATGHVTEQLCFICYGAGCNGKSVFLSTIRHVLGDYACNTGFSTFELYGRAPIPQDMAALVGKRFITASETSEGACLNEARIKAFVHGDAITARHLFQKEFTYGPAGKVWLAVNHLPKVGDQSLGFWRSVATIPFKATFTEKTIDREIGDKLKTEAPGILKWIVDGCMKWQSKGLRPFPDAVTRATDDYKESSDDLADFISDRLDTTDPESTERARALFIEYQDWADINKLPKKERLGSRTFYEHLKSRFTKLPRIGTGILYQGLRLKPRNP